MPRQPFAPIRKRNPGGHITIGTPAIGERPELERIIGNCLMVWPLAESEMALTLGQLLGIGNEAALAVFQTLRRSTAQREAIEAAAEIVLKEPDDLKLMTALLDAHKSVEAERSALAHGHFGTFDKVPEILLWTTTSTYVQLKAKLHLNGYIVTTELLDDFASRISFYTKDDLTKIYENILYCAAMWPDTINWLRSRAPQRAQLYRQLCSQPRVARELAKPHRGKIPEAPA